MGVVVGEIVIGLVPMTVLLVPHTGTLNVLIPAVRLIRHISAEWLIVSVVLVAYRKGAVGEVGRIIDRLRVAVVVAFANGSFPVSIPVPEINLLVWGLILMKYFKTLNYGRTDRRRCTSAGSQPIDMKLGTYQSCNATQVSIETLRLKTD